MTLRCQVTFEYATRPPDTWEGLVEAGGAHTCASRAVRLAKVALKPVNWTSVVWVALERLSGPQEPS